MAISADDTQQARKLAGELGLRFPVLADPDLRVIRAYGVITREEDMAAPAVFVVGQDGTILFRRVGASITDRLTPRQILRVLP